MRIPEEILMAAAKQLDADCGIGGEGKESRIVTAKNGTVFRRAPYFAPKAYMTDEAFGELVRETLEKETGIRPRIYEGIDPFFRGIVFMGRSRILAGEEIFDQCVKELGSLKNPEWLCQFSSLGHLNAMLRRHGRNIEDVRLNFLPCDSGMKKEAAASEDVTAPFEVRLLEAEELEERKSRGEFGGGAFRHAVCGSQFTPDVLAAAAVLDGRIVGIAGATEDCSTMWQIGVDVEPGQRGRGISSILVRLLKDEILRRGKIPFYATSQSHVVSMDTAVSAGFLPAWSEIYVSSGKY